MDIVVNHYNWYKRPDESEYIPDENPEITEQAYVKTSVMVKRFQDAGLRLQDYRLNGGFDELKI